MATWEAVAKMLGTRQTDIGGGIMGILLMHPDREEWFQVGDIPCDVGYTVDDADGNTLDTHDSGRTLDNWDDRTLAKMIRVWARKCGYAFPGRK